MRELEAQAKFLAPIISGAVAKALAPLQAQLLERDATIAALAKRLDELPQPDVEAIAAAAAALVPAARPGEPGKDAAPVDLDALAAAAAALVPAAQPGKDAEPVDLEAVAKAAAELIQLPEPVPGEPGKDATPVDLEAVAKAAAALITVPDAPTVDLEALAKSAAALIPAPLPGKDAPEVDLKAVAALVEVPAPAEVDLEAVAALVKPAAVDVDAIARAAAALIPPAVVPAVENGRDAADLAVLPAIDEAKQYPRNTYATHNGGLWKSYETTHGMRGWECIVDGVADIAVSQDSAREFSVTLSKSSGAQVVQKFAMPVPVYKGVFRDGDQYEAHDSVTWAGSQWHCNQATGEKPGEGKSWTLAVKRGRDGKSTVQLAKPEHVQVKL